MSVLSKLCIGLFSVLSLGCIGCTDAPGRPAAGPEVPRPDQVRGFSTLYHQNCAGCHGENGKNGAAISLANPIYLAIAGEATIRKITANGVPGKLMPSFEKSAGGTLTDQQIDSLVQGILQRGAARTPSWRHHIAALCCNCEGRSNARTENVCGFLRFLPRGRWEGSKRCPGLDCRSLLFGAGERSESAEHHYRRTTRPAHAGLALGPLRLGVACDDRSGNYGHRGLRHRTPGPSADNCAPV